MALNEISNFYEPLSLWRTWTSGILKRLKWELSEEWLVLYARWASQYASEVDVCVALWGWEDEATASILAKVSWGVQELLQDFTLKRSDYVIKMKQEGGRPTRKNGL